MPPQNKICERCNKAKPATEKYFGVSLRQRDRLKTYCRDCSPAVAAERKKRKSEKSREWARNNPEKVKEAARRTYENYREERLAYYRRYRQENKERLREYSREYAQRKRRGDAQVGA